VKIARARKRLSIGGISDFCFVDLDAEAVAGGDCKCSVLQGERRFQKRSGKELEAIEGGGAGSRFEGQSISGEGLPRGILPVELLGLDASLFPKLVRERRIVENPRESRGDGLDTCYSLSGAPAVGRVDERSADVVRRRYGLVDGRHPALRARAQDLAVALNAARDLLIGDGPPARSRRRG